MSRGWWLLVLLLPLSARATSTPLRTGWKLQSGCTVKSSGEEVSRPDYRFSGWIDAVVPGTVLGSQVAAGVFPNPFFGMNLRKIPGMDYPLGAIFGYLPMSENSPYRCAWWYRTEFNSPEGAAGVSGKITWLHFDGINYRANLWLNGKQIANSDQVAGAYRSYDFDVSPYLTHGSNVLAVQVFAETEHDLGLDFIDWNPEPADKTLGLWRGVSVETTGRVTLRHPGVSTHFTDDTLTEAALHITADVANQAEQPLSVTVTMAIGSGHVVQQRIELAAKETRAVSFEDRVEHPAVWWPYQYGDPHLERLRLAAAWSLMPRAFGSASARFRLRLTIRASCNFVSIAVTFSFAAGDGIPICSIASPGSGFAKSSST